MAIGGARDPYVHSNIENWTEGGFGNLPTITERHKVLDSISRLESIKQQLEKEAKDFLSGDTADFLNYCIDNNYKTYSDIARNLLQDPDAIEALMLGDTSVQMSKADVDKLLSQVEETLRGKIEKFINFKDITTIGARKLAIELADGLSNSEMQLTVNGGSFIGQLYKGAMGLSSNDGINNTVLKEVTGVAVNQLKSGQASARIVDAIETLIEKTGLHQSNKNNEKIFTDSIDSFMDWFRSSFINEAEKVVHFYDVEESPDKYLEEIEKKIREKIKKNFKDIYNTIGALGDEIIVSAIQADPRTIELGIKIESIGTEKEKDKNIEKKYGDVFKGVKQMVTHHDPGKQSQTDILIRNHKGQTVRVQAKNASLRNASYSNDGFINLNAHIQRDRDIISLLEAFRVPNIEDIASTIMNSLWFSAHDSVTGVRDSGKLSITNAESNEEALDNLQQELTIFFSTEAESFLGITIEKASEAEAKMIEGASNIFFLKNGRLIPTYTLVEEVIKDLRKYEEDGVSALQGFDFRIVKSSNIPWKYKNEADFWVEKAKKDFANRIAVGTEQGAAISAVKVHGTFPKVHELSSLVVNVND